MDETSLDAITPGERSFPAQKIHQSLWCYALASVVGTSHGAAGTPCQDACACQILGAETHAADASVLIAVVSDGAGSAARSQEGAALACSLFITEMESYFNEGGQVNQINRPFMMQWLEYFQREVAARAEAEGLSVRDFACTFLAAIVGETHGAFVQVGDGAIVVLGQEEPKEYDYVFWPQKGEYENMTYFATDPAILQTFEFDTVSRAIDDVSLFSDGLQRLALDFAAGVPHQPFFRPMFAPLHDAAQNADTAASAHLGTLSEALQKYLASPAVNGRTDDDKTLILATRRRKAKPDFLNVDSGEVVEAAITLPLPDTDACI